MNSYAADVASTLALKQDLAVACRSDARLLNRLAEGVDAIGDAIDALKEANDSALATKDLYERACICRDRVLPAMRDLREGVDAMELVCSSEYWPMPTYNKILFYV